MRRFCRLPLWYPLVGFLLLAGCHGQPVRHLSSDVCLLLPGQMTKKDVLGYLGDPSQRRIGSGGQEVWVYYDVKKSTLRKTPWIGDRLGYANFDVVTITFAGDLMRACVYRSLTEEEFAKAGLNVDADAGRGDQGDR